MKMPEKGVILTQFEKCFGDFLDHELIKSILQALDWDPSSSLDALVEMAHFPDSEQHQLTSLRRALKLDGGSSSNSSSSEDLSSSPKLNDGLSPRPNSPAHGLPQTQPSNSLDTINNIWDQQKAFKFNNNNVNQKATNLTSPTFTNEHRNYDRFLANSSQLSKGSSISKENDREFNKGGQPVTKESCIVSVMRGITDKKIKLMIIMRGLPGSGKSSLAKQIASDAGAVLSTDDFFINKDGVYEHNPSKLTEAHNWNRKRATECLQKGESPVIIDNTNLELWEMRPYVSLAQNYQYRVEFLEPETSWKFLPRELARRNTHGVPKAKIEEMLQRYRKNVKLSDFNKFSNVNVIGGVGNACIGRNNNSINIQPVGQANSSMKKMQNHSANNGVSNRGNRFKTPSVTNNMGGITHSPIINQVNKRKQVQGLPNSEPSVAPPLKQTISTYKSNLSNEYLMNSREPTPDDVDPETFNGMVETLGEQMKKQIDNSKQMDIKATVTDSESEECRVDDVEMYKFCEDVEDKLGNTISALIRQEVKESQAIDEIYDENSSFPDTPLNTRVTKAPDLDTVTEELSKDLISKGGSDNSDMEDTCNDASSVEFNLNGETVGGTANDSQCSAWNSVGRETDWDKEDQGSEKFAESKPLEARNVTKGIGSKRMDPELKNLDSPKTENTDNSADSWVSNFDVNTWQDDYDANVSLLRKTGAVPKRHRFRQSVCSKENSGCNKSQAEENIDSSTKVEMPGASNLLDNSKRFYSQEDCSLHEIGTQTSVDSLSVDTSSKTLFGDSSRYSLGEVPAVPGEGAMTRGNLRLDKSTMTEKSSIEVNVGSLEQLQCYFPEIPVENLKDILDNCRGELDWATNILLDGGYQMTSTPSEVSSSDKVGPSPEVDSMANSNSASASGTPCNSSDESSESLMKRKKKRTKFKKVPVDEIFNIPESESKAKLKAKYKKQKPKTPKAVTNETEVPLESSSPVKASNDEEMNLISTELDPLLANQLVNIFGPVGNLSINHSFSKEERSLTLPLNICREIHHYWSLALESNNREEEKLMKKYLDADVAFASQLQAEENSKALGSRPSSPTCFFQGFNCETPPTNLREIMQLEQAIEKSEKKLPVSSMSLKLSEKQLCEQFSHIDSKVVKDMLQKCSGRFEETTNQLLLKYGIPPVKEPESQTEEQPAYINIFGQAYKDTQKAEELERYEHEDILNALNEDDDEYDLQKSNDEVDLYYNLRKDLLDKARCTTGPYKAQVASHYARQASMYTSKMLKAHLKASAYHLKDNNITRDPNTLDLHLLRVTTAVSTCKAFLEERQRALNSMARAGGSRRVLLTLITGWGKHSSKQVAKLKPSVKSLLVREGYKFSEVPENPGILTVVLTA